MVEMMDLVLCMFHHNLKNLRVEAGGGGGWGEVAATAGRRLSSQTPRGTDPLKQWGADTHHLGQVPPRGRSLHLLVPRSLISNRKIRRGPTFWGRGADWMNDSGKHAAQELATGTTATTSMAMCPPYLCPPFRRQGGNVLGVVRVFWN